jgi:hypothetical protein
MATLHFEHTLPGLIALFAALATIAVAFIRRPAVPPLTFALCAIGLALLTFAAAGFTFRRAVSRPVAVMVDLSASTRGATYRDAAALNRRIHELLGNLPHEIRNFGEANDARTTLPPIDAPAAILFSDGRLANLPSSLPPVFAVIDPALESPADAAVTSLEPSADSVSVAIRNTSPTPRPLSLNGNLLQTSNGSFTFVTKINQNTPAISASFSPGDLWPENDAMRATPPPPPTARRIWVGERASLSAGWSNLKPAELSRQPAAFLGTSLVVLDNISAPALDAAQQAALANYVRDLGGGLVILGGDSSFAAGGYAGTTLDELSPLASTPPEPTVHWMLLADASGSMNQDAGGKTRWQFASSAIVHAIAQLPPEDLLSIGSFADDVRWWSSGRSVRDTGAMRLPPDDVQPRGRTNLESALRDVAQGTGAKMPVHLLIATDAQTTIDDAAGLAALLKSRQMTLHVLLIGDENSATALPALRQVIATTGGSLRIEQLPQNWSAGLRELLHATQASHLRRETASVVFGDKLASLGAMTTSVWNQTWPKSQTVPLAETATPAGEKIVMAARWNLGEGTVASVAFPPPENVVDALAKAAERPPRDPRFSVTWQPGPMLRVAIDAVENGRFMNGQSLSLELTGSKPIPLPQSGPGRYAIEIDAPQKPAIAKVRHDQQVLDIRAIAGRYASEFDAVGNDRAALSDLARRTGGALIEPGDPRRLDIPFPLRSIHLVSVLSLVGAAMIMLGLIRWRVGS